MEIDNISEIEDLDEYFDYEVILQRMLDRVPLQIDKREGSIIYTALAPAAAELAQMYILLKSDIDLVFVDTAVDEYLDRLVNQIGIVRHEATFAIKKGCFYDEDNTSFNVTIGERFTIENVVYKVIEKIEDGIYKMECETAGIIGNDCIGKMIPVNYIEGLAEAELTDILIPGEDKEDDESLRSRYYEQTNEKAFGGNVAYYTIETKKIAGVGAVKVTPIWDGPGSVKLTILDSNYDKASNVLIENVQKAICPNLSAEGLGIAPIGHIVTVDTVMEKEIYIKLELVIEDMTRENVKDKIEKLIESYFLSLRKYWEDSDKLEVVIVQIQALIVNSKIAKDIVSITINDGIENLELEKNEIPILKEVVVL